MEAENKKKKQLKVDSSNLEELRKGGIRVSYVRFKEPIPAIKNKTPVSEMRLVRFSPHDEYVVDSLLYIPGKCLIWEAAGEENAADAGNIKFVRFCQE
jgi:hypothetical protein